MGKLILSLWLIAIGTAVSAGQFRTIEVQGRDVEVYKPDTYSGSVVVLLHGGGGTAKKFMDNIKPYEAADTLGFALIAPQGQKGHWAVGAGTAADDARIDDVAFLTAVLAEADKRLGYDRAYMVGVSNGGMMAYRFACETEQIAGLGVVAATLIGKSCATPTERLLHIHGADDQSVVVEGGIGANTSRRCRTDPRCDRRPIAEAVGHFFESNLIILQDHGHAWPGAGSTRKQRDAGVPVRQDFDATTFIFEFLAD